MSHLIASQIIINDLDILKKAVAGFGGLTWNEGATSYKWYMNMHGREKLTDYIEASKEAEAAQGQCEHSISIDTKKGKGYGYEIGVVRRKDGEGWSLVFDPYDRYAARAVGYSCEKVMSAYAEEYTRDFAAKHGFMIEHSTDDEGNVVLIMNDNG